MAVKSRGPIGEWGPVMLGCWRLKFVELLEVRIRICLSNWVIISSIHL